MIAFKHHIPEQRYIEVKTCDRCGNDDSLNNDDYVIVVTMNEGLNVCLECILADLLDEEPT